MFLDWKGFCDKQKKELQGNTLTQKIDLVAIVLKGGHLHSYT
jgi:hypothetical protein